MAADKGFRKLENDFGVEFFHSNSTNKTAGEVWLDVESRMVYFSAENGTGSEGCVTAKMTIEDAVSFMEAALNKLKENV